MIPSAPVDFWVRVSERVALLLYERETRVGGASEPRVVPLAPAPREPTSREEKAP